jgi:hypothetical protein
MKLNIIDGYLKLEKNITLFRGMRRNDLLSGGGKWEDWITRDKETISYKTTIKNEKNPHENIIIIVFFEKENGPIIFWDLGPENNMNGYQSKIEGKYTKKIRQWFLNEFNINLPQSEFWGEIDAFYDPHNLTTSVICSYSRK